MLAQVLSVTQKVKVSYFFSICFHSLLDWPTVFVSLDLGHFKVWTLSLKVGIVLEKPMASYLVLVYFLSRFPVFIYLFILNGWVGGFPLKRNLTFLSLVYFYSVLVAFPSFIFQPVDFYFTLAHIFTILFSRDCVMIHFFFYIESCIWFIEFCFLTTAVIFRAWILSFFDLSAVCLLAFG